MLDFHVHTSISPDGSGTVLDCCRQAEQAGAEGFCLTEHIDLGYSHPEFENAGAPEKSCTALLEAARNFPSLKLRLGIEAGFNPETATETAMLLAGEPLDFCINSVHEINGVDPYYGTFFTGKTRAQAYGEYLECVFDSLDAPYDYSVIGHIGYLSRYAPYPHPALEYEDFPELLDGILMRIIILHKGIELNTSLLASGNPLPSASVLKRYAQLGGTIVTLGSDAHSPQHLYKGFPQACQLLKSCGINQLADFVQMKPSFTSI